MPIIKYAYKFRLYPADDQQMLLAKQFGANRFVYNHFLQSRMNEHTNYKKNALDLTQLKKWPQGSLVERGSMPTYLHEIDDMRTAHIIARFVNEIVCR